MTAGNTMGSAAPTDAGQTMLAQSAQQMGADAGAAGADATASSGAVSASDRKAAEEIFTSRCVTCHGSTGKGDGPASAALNPKPRSFGDAAWQKSVTDEHIEKVIAQGGPAAGKSPLMPPNPDLAGKPVVKALREKVRSFAK
jgi:mono/diheme cytochrome c family protein